MNDELVVSDDKHDSRPGDMSVGAGTDQPIPFRPKKQFLRVATKLFVVVALVLGAAFYHIGLPYVREQLAVAKIRRHGGTVLVVPGGPDGLRAIVGMRCMQVFDRVYAVNLSDTFLDDDVVQCLRDLKGLQQLRLDNTKLTSIGFKHLAALTELRVLSLEKTRVTDRDLVHIAGLRHLQDLSLGDDITDAGLNHLYGLTDLRRLWCKSNTTITSAGAAKLRAALPNCKISEYGQGRWPKSSARVQP